jgi:hypothetical protein
MPPPNETIVVTLNLNFEILSVTIQGKPARMDKIVPGADPADVSAYPFFQRFTQIAFLAFSKDRAGLQAVARYVKRPDCTYYWA